MPKAKLNLEPQTVLFIFEDEVAGDAEKGVEGKPSRQEFNLAHVTPEMLAHLALHGAKQKIADSYAGAKESGTDPLAYAKQAVADTIKQLYAPDFGGTNEWSVGRTASGTPRATMLVQAFAEVGGMSLEEAQEFIGTLSDEEKTAIAKKPKIAAKVAQYKAEAAVRKAKELAEKAEKAEAAELAAATA